MEGSRAGPRGGAAKGAQGQCFHLGVSLDRELIPSGKRFAWLALCQTLHHAGCLWLAPSRKPPGPCLLHILISVAVVIRCPWRLDFCQGCGVLPWPRELKSGKWETWDMIRRGR